MQQPRTTPSARRQSPASTSSRVSSIPRPTLTTKFDNSNSYSNNNSFSAQNDPQSSTQAPTPDTLKVYGPRREFSPISARSPNDSAVSAAARSFERPSLRSASGPALSPSRSSPTITGAERLQKSSFKDLVARFNDADTSQPTSPPTASPHTVPRKPTPLNSPGAMDSPRTYLDRAQPSQSSTTNVTRNPQRSPARRPVPSHDPDKPLFLSSAVYQGSIPSASSDRPKTADDTDASSEQSGKPLFGEVVGASATESPRIGHGIPYSNARRGSEGSLHYPNAMFPSGRTSYIEDSSVADGRQNNQKSNPGPLSSSQAASSNEPSTPLPITSPSRLPVPSARDGIHTNSVSPSATNPDPLQPSTPPLPSQPKETDASPGKSPGSSKRLNAIINAPAPKESPPLRSSRPRQDVTTARSPSPGPNSNRENAQPLTASPQKSKLFAGVDMDMAARRNSIRKTLREERERTMQNSPSSSQRMFGRAPNNTSRAATMPTTMLAPQTRPAQPTTATRSNHTSRPSQSNLNTSQQAAVTQNARPSGLKLDVNTSRHRPVEKPVEEPVSGTTQFEDDDSPVIEVSQFPTGSGALMGEPVPIQNSQSGESGSNIQGDTSGNQADRQISRSRTVLSQIMEMRHNNPSKFHSMSQSSTIGSAGDQDDAGTIQIMLSDSPAVNRQSAGWQSRDLHHGSNENEEVQGGDSPIIHDESISSTPSVRTWTSQNERESSSTTLDKDYSLINRILDQYRESGAVSADMVQDFQQHVLEIEPDLSAGAYSESMNIAKAAIEEIIKDHSEPIEPMPDTPHSSEALSAHAKPYWEGLDPYMAIASADNFQAEAGQTEYHELPGPTPPPKDLDQNPLAIAGGDAAQDTGASQGTFGSSAYTEDALSLPAMPSTGGNFGFNTTNASERALPNGVSIQSPTPPAHDQSQPTFETSPALSEQATLGQNTTRSSLDQLSAPNTAGVRFQEPPSSHSRGPSVDKEGQVDNSSDSQGSDQRRLTQRRHLIKELIDTEYSYNQDMKVIEDIYKGTASSVQALTTEDQRVLFGNSAQVVEFSEAFLDALKQASRSVYRMPRASQWRVNPTNPSETNSGSQTEESSLASFEATDDERDRKTFIGDAFNNNMTKMEKVYSEYLKNHDFANQRLQKLQNVPQVQLWLNECHAYANDITSAWDLDSLLVKPVQRILKYPLLLRSLLEQTPNDHPDHSALEQAVKQSEDVSHRINEAKKRAELLEQVVSKNAKRKDLDLTKIFSRRTDKIAHRVGLSEAVEDPDYRKLHERFGGRYFQLQVVMRDIDMYKKKTEEFMNQFNRYIGAIEELMDVAHSNSPELESKWRKFAVTVREMTAIAYADHEVAVRKHCIDPIITAIKLHDGPQKLMIKRKKRIVEYAKYLTAKNRGEKISRSLQEQGDQFIALNDTLKDELPKLFNLTAKVVEACLKNFVDLQMHWHTVWQRKIKTVLEDQQVPADWANIVDAFHSDFSYTEAHVLALGICNGSLLAETSNFLSSASSFTMSDDSSSTKKPSVAPYRTSPSITTSEFKRGSAGSSTNNLSYSYASPRTSADSSAPQQRNGGYGQGASAYQPRYRADSNLSTSSANAWTQQAPTSTPATAYNQTYNPGAYAPHQASRYRRASDLPPPLSQQHSYSNAPGGGGRTSNGATRPSSSSTFYSATSSTTATYAPPQREQAHGNDGTAEPRYSGLFSSAMPMSDSPEDLRPSSPGALGGGGAGGQRHHAYGGAAAAEPTVLFTAASMFEFRLDRQRREAGYPYLNYNAGEIFNVIGEKGELWLARNQDDPTQTTGWIWEKHFAKLVTDD